MSGSIHTRGIKLIHNLRFALFCFGCVLGALCAMLPLLPFSKSLFVSLIQTPGHTLDTLNQGGPNFSIGVQNGGPPAGDATEKCPHTPFKADNGHFTRVALSPPCGEHGIAKSTGGTEGLCCVRAKVQAT